MIERDKFLTEAMGECVFSHKDTVKYTECMRCGQFFTKHANNDFSTWEGFGKLWEWAQGQEWWQTFIYVTEKDHPDLMWAWCPETFANVVYEYLKDRR